MAGSISQTDTYHVQPRGIVKHSIDWTSDASGDVSGHEVTLLSGTIVACTFAPGTGVTQPTNLYDATIICAIHGVDVLNGAGADLADAPGNHRGVFIQTTDKTAFTRQWLHGGLYLPVISNAGNVKSGTIDLYIYYMGVL